MGIKIEENKSFIPKGKEEKLEIGSCTVLGENTADWSYLGRSVNGAYTFKSPRFTREIFISSGEVELINGYPHIRRGFLEFVIRSAQNRR